MYWVACEEPLGVPCLVWYANNTDLLIDFSEIHKLYKVPTLINTIIVVNLCKGLINVHQLWVHKDEL